MNDHAHGRKQPRADATYIPSADRADALFLIPKARSQTELVRHPSEDIGHPGAEGGGQLLEVHQRDAALPPLKPAHVGVVPAGQFAELLLREQAARSPLRT